MKNHEKSPPAEAEGPLDRTLDAVSSGRPAGRAFAGRAYGRPDGRLDGPDPAAADRASVGDSAGRPVGRLDHLADRLGRPVGRLDSDYWTLETSPDRGMAPQNFNELQERCFRTTWTELARDSTLMLHKNQ